MELVEGTVGQSWSEVRRVGGGRHAEPSPPPSNLQTLGHKRFPSALFSLSSSALLESGTFSLVHRTLTRLFPLKSDVCRRVAAFPRTVLVFVQKTNRMTDLPADLMDLHLQLGGVTS